LRKNAGSGSGSGSVKNQSGSTTLAERIPVLVTLFDLPTKF
jgi:hypothetical protein